MASVPRGGSMSPLPVSRRRLLGGLAAAGAAASVLGGRIDDARSEGIITRAIPSTGEKLPAVGLGSWITFNVGDNAGARRVRGDILRAFLESGGRLVDS